MYDFCCCNTASSVFSLKCGAHTQGCWWRFVLIKMRDVWQWEMETCYCSHGRYRCQILGSKWAQPNVQPQTRVGCHTCHFPHQQPWWHSERNCPPSLHTEWVSVMGCCPQKPSHISVDFMEWNRLLIEQWFSIPILLVLNAPGRGSHKLMFLAVICCMLPTHYIKSGPLPLHINVGKATFHHLVRMEMQAWLYLNLFSTSSYVRSFKCHWLL